MHVAGKNFGKTCLKAIGDFLVRVYRTEGRSSNFLAGRGSSPPRFPLLLGHPDFPIRKTLRRVLGLLAAMILKRVSDSIFFQSNKFTACKIKDGIKVANSLMVFNLLNIIHPFQGKKHVRT